MAYDNGKTDGARPMPPSRQLAPKGNVLVLGNSGVGKSTLINAVIGDDVAKTSFGTSGTTKELSIYESPSVPFRVIDSIGFEPSPIAALRAVHAVRAWSRASAKEGNENTRINVIWFCVDGTAAKLFRETIRNLANAVRMWKSVPIVAAVTKSYSQPDRERNVAMVREAFHGTRIEYNLRAIVPVVAQTYVINDTAFAAPEGVADLIDATMEAMPDGLRGGAHDLQQFKLTRKRMLAQGLIGACVAAGATVGAVPIPIADTLVLSPLELAELNGLARLYGIDKDEDAKQFLDSIVQVGTASVIAHSAISAIKAIPGLNLAASVVNAIVAASIIAALGEGAVAAFEQVYTGRRSMRDLGWVRQLMEEQFGNAYLGKVSAIAEAAQGGGKDMRQMIIDLVKSAFLRREK
ncbi:GTPase [Bifidobacterium sp. AGR2158]|uniref:GTPase n=1 Tax=Bifidobacterium sp. AGR2158 TaxID=1280675 RepID=UPI0004000612|nr:GTPase [Bifidobacterium sp. AGR2158]